MSRKTKRKPDLDEQVKIIQTVIPAEPTPSRYGRRKKNLYKPLPSERGERNA